MSYPLAKHGKLIGEPGQGTHSFTAAPNNWQSDNAVDIGVPSGTPVLAVTDGVVAKTGGQAGTAGRFAGFNLTLDGSDNAYFYAHLSNVTVRPGMKVKKGQVLGYSGAANGVEHLHFGQEHGTPDDTIKGKGGGGFNPLEFFFGIGSGPAKLSPSSPGDVLGKGADRIASAVVDLLFGAIGETGARILLYLVFVLGGTAIAGLGLARMVGVRAPLAKIATAVAV